jgi:RNA polymerase sigma factor (TIGR02999 family)
MLPEYRRPRARRPLRLSCNIERASGGSGVVESGGDEPKDAGLLNGSSSTEAHALIYSELMRMARSQLARAGTMSLDAPSLVHEAWLRFERQGAIATAQRNVFFAYSARVMRAVIVDHVRHRGAQKRGSGEAKLTLTTGLHGLSFGEDGIEPLHEALQALEKLDQRSHQVVELRYFGGLSEEEIAGVLDVSVPTVKRDWRKARAFLFDVLGAAP